MTKLHLLCGKIASGKSTLAAKLAEQQTAMVISEDQWLRDLFGDQMQSISDFAVCSQKLRSTLKPHLI